MSEAVSYRPDTDMPLCTRGSIVPAFRPTIAQDVKVVDL